VQALRAIGAEMDNGRAAWNHAIRQRHFALIEASCAVLNLFLTLNSMHYEALSLMKQALDALLATPESPERDRHELVLQSALLAPMSCVYGWEDRHFWPVTERICELARRVGDDERLVMGLSALVNLYINEEWERAVEVGQEALAFSHTVGRREATLGFMMNEAAFLFTGRLAQCLDMARKGQALYDPADGMWFTTVVGMDAMVSSLTHSGCVLTYLGYADQGEHDLALAEARAIETGQPMALGFVMAFATMAYVCTREWAKSIATGLRLRDLAEQHRFGTWQAQWPAYSTIGLVQRGDYEEGIAALGPAIEIERQAGLTHNMTAWLAHLGYALGRTGRLEPGLIELDRAAALAERTGERFHMPVILRLRGELLRLRGDLEAATVQFERAIRVAQVQQSRFYELQAMLSLYDLCEAQGRASEARPRLLTLYDWFSEGFDRPDLLEARRRLGANSEI
jgi:tetratricopeptide (TPR) repeat protein